MSMRQKEKRDYLELSSDTVTTESDVDVFTSSSDESIATTPLTSSLTNSTDDDSDCVVLTPKEQQQPLTIVIKPQLSLVGPQTKEAPFRRIRNVDAIYGFLSERVLNQPAVFTVASAISAAINRSLLGDVEHIHKVDTLTLAGTSGCGKTETVLSVKHLLGMDRGYEFADQFVFIDGSTMSESFQVNNLCGAPTGTVGYGDGHTLADRLNKAINKPLAKKPSNRPQHKKLPMTDNHKKTKEVPPPPFIMVFIDELHMVHVDFLKAINGLIDTACYAAPNGSGVFEKPAETTMIIMFTCNYGAHGIAELTPRDDIVACQMIDQDMRESGVCPYTIGRLGTICPYYPLENDVLEALTKLRLYKHLQSTPLASTFGRNKRISVSEEATTFLVDHVLKRVNADLGVRGAMTELFQRLDLLAEKAFSILHDRGGTITHDEELVLTGHTFSLRHFNEDDDEGSTTPLISLIKKNPANAQALALCRHSKDEHISVNSMGMRKGDIELCQFIIPIHIVINHHHHHHHHDEELQDKVQLLEEKLERIATLVRNTGNNRLAILDILDDKEAPHNKKRKEIEDAQDQPKSKKKKNKDTTLLKASKPGRKPKPMEGFKPSGYNASIKRYIYMCDTCSLLVDARQIESHMCQEASSIL